MQVGDKVYRVDNGVYNDIPFVTTLFVTKLTPAGYYAGYYKEFNPSDWWCGNVHIKRYAYPNLEDALQNFVKRKERQIAINMRQMERAKANLENINLVTVDNKSYSFANHSFELEDFLNDSPI